MNTCEEISQPLSNENSLCKDDPPKKISPKHVLHNSWTLWFDNPKLKRPNESWEENLKKVYTFNTVEDFWCLFNSIQPASQITPQSTYHLFKTDIKPMWEDKQNINGGKWLITLTRYQRDRVDKLWLHTVLAVIGETLDETGDIAGCVISLRAGKDRISLWTKTSCDAQIQLTIGQRLRVALGLSDDITLSYQSHRDAANSGSSFKNNVLYEA